MNNEQNLLKEIDDLKIEIKKLKAHKKYGLVWGEKPEKFEKDSVGALPILLEKGGKFKDVVNNKKDDFNILIEGDNYHSLSVLNYTHKGKIDVIYIDPPYNTGNKDFIYNDSFVDKEDRYRHSKWLSFMEKRLKLAKTLLSKSGVIFISIDDNEQAQLKLLCNSIFGEENFINNIVWKKTNSPKFQSANLGNQYEFILIYAKNRSLLSLNRIYKPFDEKSLKPYSYDDSKGKFRLIELEAQGIQNNVNRKKSKFKDRTAPWIYSIETLERWDKEGLIYKTNNGRYAKKQYLENMEGVLIADIWIDSGINPLQGGSEEYVNFETQKPLSLIKRVLKLASKKNSIILDFFAGSGTTGQAVLEFNKEDEGNRRFILCTNNGDEKSEHKICEDICFKRLNTVMSKGYKDKKPLDGNLKYLKTDFIKYKDTNIDTLKRKIVEASTEVLCLKENTFDLVKDLYKGEKIKIYQNKNKYTAILFDLFYLDEFIERLKELKDKHISIYVFSYTKEFDRDEIGHLSSSYSIEPIPENILETYKKIFNF